MASGYAVGWRIEQGTELTGGAVLGIAAGGAAVGIAAVGRSATHIHPARSAELLLAEERSGIAWFGAGAIAQAAVASGAIADPAASVQIALPRYAGGVATGVVFGADVPAGAIGIIATGVRPGNTPELRAAFSAAGTIGVVTTLAFARVIAFATVVTAFGAGLAAGAAEATEDARRFTALIVAVAGAVAAGAATAHRIAVGATFGAAGRAAAGAADGGFRYRRLGRERWTRESAPGGIGRLQRRCGGGETGSQAEEALEQ